MTIPFIEQAKGESNKQCSCGAKYNTETLKEQGCETKHGFWGNCKECKSTLFLKIKKSK